jgi:hypothetical protein
VRARQLANKRLAEIEAKLADLTSVKPLNDRREIPNYAAEGS